MQDTKTISLSEYDLIMQGLTALVENAKSHESYVKKLPDIKEDQIKLIEEYYKKRIAFISAFQNKMKLCFGTFHMHTTTSGVSTLDSILEISI